MRRITTALTASAAALLLLAGAAGAADAAPAAKAVTDKTCPYTLAQAKSYATRPSTVRSTKTASCVFKYVASINPTQGFTRSAAVAYSVIDDSEYGDYDGVTSRSAHGTYSASTSAAYEVDESYDHLAELQQQGSDQATLRYLDQKAGAVYIDRPQKVQGWTRATAAAESGQFVLNSANLFKQNGFRITAWSKSASHGRNTWTFTLGGRLDGGTARFVVASSGELISGTSSVHFDGDNSTRVTTFAGSYGRVNNVAIPPEVVAAAR